MRPRSIPDALFHVQSPVIVLGMHRSGTSLLSLVLQGLGVFMGKDLQQDGESETFLALNERIFSAVPSASWDHPGPVGDFMANGGNKAKCAAFFRNAFSQGEMKSYLGPARLPGANWGWKDPRNCFTLPAWLEVFPNARFIHVLRNGIDVAESLRVRHSTVIDTFTRINGTHPPANGFFRIGAVKFTHRPATLSGGFSLWQEYAGHARRLLRASGAPSLEIRYESLCENPRALVDRLADFLGIAPDEATITRILDKIVAENGYKFCTKPHLIEFARKVQSEKMFGYRPIIREALINADKRSEVVRNKS